MFDKLKQAIAQGANNLLRKYDQNWFVRFLNIAHQEDALQGTGVSDVMKQHAWVNIAVSAIARNIARAPYRLYSGDTLIESGPEYDLFLNVNPMMSRYQLWEATVSWLQTQGECIWIFENEYTGGLPAEIYPVNPLDFKHTIDRRTRHISMWKWQPEGATEAIPFLPSEIIHFKLWNKWDMYRGVNPCISTGYEIRQDVMANRSNIALLRNGSIPDGVLRSDNPDLTPEQAIDIRKVWMEQHRGENRAHTISVLSKGLDYKPITMSPRDMEYFEMKKWNRQTILAKYGVNPRIVGASDDSSPLSGQDTKEQMKGFWSLTLSPVMQFLVDKMATDFFRRFKSKTTGKFDTSEIPELQESKDEQLKRYLEPIKAGLVLINEAREEIGYEDPLPWGDTWHKPMALVDVSGDDMRNVTPPPPAIPPPKKSFDTVALGKNVFSGNGKKAIETKTMYTAIYRNMHWWKTIRAWEAIEKEFKQDLKDWFFEQRKRNLDIIAAHTKAFEPGMSDIDIQILRDIELELLDEAYWKAEELALKDIATKHFTSALGFTGVQLKQLFTDMGLAIGTTFDIFETGAVKFLDLRVNKGNLASITETTRKNIQDKINGALTEGWDMERTGEEIRGVYQQAANRAETIARTELGGIINDSRQEGFRSAGFEYESWLSAQDGNVRTPGHPKGNFYNHLIDGEIAKLDELFSNGLRYPNDPEGAAGNVINCRCVALPEMKGNTPKPAEEL